MMKLSKTPLILSAFLVCLITIAFVFFGSTVVKPSAAQAQQSAQQPKVVKWEYRAIHLAPGVNQVLNSDVTDVSWELLAATDTYLVFRRVAQAQ